DDVVAVGDRDLPDAAAAVALHRDERVVALVGRQRRIAVAGERGGGQVPAVTEPVAPVAEDGAGVRDVACRHRRRRGLEVDVRGEGAGGSVIVGDGDGRADRVGGRLV